MKKNIIIIGARGYKYNYGGWETFVTNLVSNYQDKDTCFYIPNLTHNKEEDLVVNNIDGVVSPSIYVPLQGFVTMFTFTIKAIKYYIKYIKENDLENVILYILGCRVGPMFLFWKKVFNKMGVKVIINPDGLEWKREKWSWWIKICFKISERMMIKYSDYCVCDSKAIKEYIDKEYVKYHTPTFFIAYGSYLKKNVKNNSKALELMKSYNIKPYNYYLIVGRFIPENNYEVMIREFMKTKINKDLVIICNLEENKFYEKLKEKTNFEADKRIKFIGSVYNQDELLTFRFLAYAYLHGHSAGGTNPSLLEALSCTNVNILFDVAYNKEVGLDSCFYFNKDEDNLKKVLNEVDKLSIDKQLEYGKLCKKRIKDEYTWDIVVNKYQELFSDILK